jgi:tripartite-type tricarboxylate transporter receptor subunit TctC
MQDLIGGQIDLSIQAASTSLPAVRDGKIKAHAVTAKVRWAAAPEIPTVDEAGLPGLYVSLWRGWWPIIKGANIKGESSRHSI